jgi:membrane protein DedA with SNARE-associated domain
LISIPAGIFGMPLGRFLIYTAIGTTLWSVLLLLAGYYLGAQFEQVKSYLSPVGDIVLIVLIAWYLYRVVTFRQRVQPADN